MARSTWVLAATSLGALAATIYLFLDNRSLRAERDAATEQVASARAAAQPAPGPPLDPWLDAKQLRDPKIAPSTATPEPKLPEEPKESRLERRVRRTDDFAARFGRLDGETEDEYRARVMPLIKMGLAFPRERAAEARKLAEEKAKVTPEQSAKLDQAFEKVYDDVLDYTNKAIQDGQLSPYERNVAGWLDYAGGLGGILNEAQGQVGKILDPSQVKTMYDAGFEWGEYLGAFAPWENLRPPPPR